MKTTRLIFFAACVFLFATLPIPLHAKNGSNTKKAGNNEAEKSEIFFKRKFDDEFFLQANFTLAGGFNFTQFKNYPLVKLDVDIVEAWFGRLGVSSVIGATFGFEPKDSSVLISQLTSPCILFSWDFGLGLYAGAGIGMTTSWHYFKQQTETESVSLSGTNVARRTEKIAATTTLRSYGISVPVKVRFALNRYVSIYSEYTFSAYPWISVSAAKSPDWILANTMTAGISASIPLKI